MSRNLAMLRPFVNRLAGHQKKGLAIGGIPALH
jgi:hypothetical protein